MSHTDPIADMLTRIRNAVMAEKKDVEIPLSKVKLEIAKIFKKEGYILNYTVDKAAFPAKLTIQLKYKGKKQNVIEGIKRISKPGLRVFSEVEKIPKVFGGLGVALVSTSKGILTGRECKEQNVGGEVLLYIW